MADQRKPEAVISLRVGDVKHKLELFSSHQFPTMTDTQFHDAEDVPTVRVRHDGVWLPPGMRKLMTLDAVMDLVKSEISDKLKEGERG